MRIVNIESLREKVESGDYDILTVMSKGNSEESPCTPIDLGTYPLQKLLEDPEYCELLLLTEASPIWNKLLDNIDKNRPIYRVLEKDGSFVEMVIFEKI